jgi:thermostable 8-oxoguanine DNA glycosylase
MMIAETRSTRLDSAELSRLAELYDLERYLFGEVFRRFQREQALSACDFFAIVTWKANRAKTRVKKGLLDAGTSVRQLMKEVSQADSPVDKVEILCNVKWIGIPIASAILSVCYPTEFTVLDYRAWEALKQASVEGLPERPPRYAQSYLQYCEACRRFADRMGLSLRDLDRALWAKNWEDDLLELCKGL